MCLFKIFKMKSISIFLVSLLIITSCKKEESTDEPNTIKALTINNVAYGAAALQKMDVYLPANRSIAQTKVIIMVHGGGWTTGDKADYKRFADTLLKRFPDQAIFNINYRLSAFPNNLFPTQEMDVKAAVEFIYSKKNEYLISDNFALIGESAGAHLSMLYAYKYNSPLKIKAVASFFGPADLTDMYNNPVNGNNTISLGMAQAVGSTPASNPTLYIQSSPVTFITSSSAVPTILLHGSNDALVSPSQSLLVKNKLIAAGVQTQYVLYPGKDHGFDWDDLTFYDAFNKIQAFFMANL